MLTRVATELLTEDEMALKEQGYPDTSRRDVREFIRALEFSKSNFVM